VRCGVSNGHVHGDVSAGNKGKATGVVFLNF
jgi:hypothetical protein